MAIESRWLAVTAQPFTADGTQFGVIDVADTAGFKVKQLVFVTATATPILQLQVKKVLSPTRLIVGPNDNVIKDNATTNLTAYTVANGASLAAPEQEKKARPPRDDHYAATYESDPTVGDRVVLVDQYGRFYGAANPMPIIFDGTISIGEVEIIGPSGHRLDPNSDGSIDVNVVSSPTGDTVINRYAEVTAVPSGVPTILVSYTVPNLKTAILQRISVSGENIARYDVLLNSQPIDTRRTNFGADLSQSFEFLTNSGDGVLLSAGDVLAVRVTHTRPYVGDFEGRIQVLQKN